MKNKLKPLFLIYFILTLFTGCVKNEINNDEQVEEYYFEAKVGGVESVAEKMSMTSYGDDWRWIIAEDGTGAFKDGSGICIRIKKKYITVGEYTLNSNSSEKYVGEFLTKSYNGEVDSIYSTNNTNVNGILTIDKIEDANSETFKNLTGRFAYYAVEGNNGKEITYGKFKILVHAFLLD